MARGEQAALGAFYDATVGRAYALALRIVRDPDAAEDVLADTYLQVWKEAGRYNAERGNPLAWLLTICRSRALDFLRRRDPAELAPAPEAPDAEKSGTVSDTLDLVACLQENQLVRRAVKALPEVQRQLLALAFFRGLSHQEIADHARLPLGTVKSHLRKAQDALRRSLEKQLSK
jgi:RNA polymerase sigma-70 factor (ECF subfamily)